MLENVHMMGDRIIVEPIENSDINPGGVVYTGQPKTTFGQHLGKSMQVCIGRVVAVGNGKRHPKTGKRIRPDVSPGAYITFSDSCHRPIEIGGTEYRYLKEGDIMTISDEPPEHVSIIYDEPGISIPAT